MKNTDTVTVTVTNTDTNAHPEVGQSLSLSPSSSWDRDRDRDRDLPQESSLSSPVLEGEGWGSVSVSALRSVALDENLFEPEFPSSPPPGCEVYPSPGRKERALRTAQRLERWMQGVRNYLLTVASAAQRQQWGPHLANPSDLVQDTLLTAYQRRERFVGASTREFQAWTLKILKFKLLEASRQARKARKVHHAPAGEPTRATDDSRRGEDPAYAIHADPARNLLDAEQRAFVASILTAMTPYDQELLRMRKWEGASFEEIGARLRISPSAARKACNRAWLRFQSLLAAHWE